MPQALRPIFKEIFTLKFEDEPPYQKLIDNLANEIKKEVQLDKNLMPMIHSFEWAKNYASHVKAKIINEDKLVK